MKKAVSIYICCRFWINSYQIWSKTVVWRRWYLILLFDIPGGLHKQVILPTEEWGNNWRCKYQIILQWICSKIFCTIKSTIYIYIYIYIKSSINAFVDITLTFFQNHPIYFFKFYVCYFINFFIILGRDIFPGRLKTLQNFH